MSTFSVCSSKMARQVKRQNVTYKLVINTVLKIGICIVVDDLESRFLSYNATHIRKTLCAESK